MAADPGPPAPPPREARDVMAFGQEFGRVLSDGRMVGRAEPFAKVFPSSRVVKRAVGLAAWGVLEDIALDARIDDRGRLVAETSVRRIAGNLGLNKDTVAKHLGRLREHGFVLQEESREVTSGRWEPCRYVLDPSACVERFTVTPAEPPRPRPCPTSSDTAPATVSRNTGHGDAGQGDLGRYEEHGVEEQQHVAGVAEGDEGQALQTRLRSLGVAAHVAADLVERYPLERVRDAVEAAAGRRARNTAGWLVTALRDGWDLEGLLAEQRTATARREAQRRTADAALARRSVDDEQAARGAGWAQAISAALDEDALTRAVTQVTTPIAGLGRRSVPLTQAQLTAWAIAVQRGQPEAPLTRALTTALEQGSRPAAVVDEEVMPEPPASGPAPDLRTRLRGCLDRVDPARAAARADPSVPARDDTCGLEL